MRAWLRARLFLTNYRPVPLTEHAVFQGTVYEKVCGQTVHSVDISSTLPGVILLANDPMLPLAMWALS